MDLNLGSLIIHVRVDGGELKTAEVALNNLGVAANKAAAKSATSFKHVISQTNMFAQRVRTIGYLTSAVLTAPILGAGKAILDATKDFEYSMQMIVGLVGESQSTVDQWKESLLKMGKEVGKTPKELAEGLYFLTSSGIQGAEALNVLEISAKAATAGLGQTQEVADLLSSALNAYAGTGLTAAKAADILVAAVREGKGEADAFARSMGQIIPIAANLGVSFDQVAGAMAAMTLTGSSAANAAVYLKGVFNSLMTANDQGAKVLERAGSSYQKLRDILKSGPEGLINVLQEFRDIQMQLGDEAVKDVLPNIRALTGFMSIAGKNFQYNSKIMREITKSTGALNAAFMAMEGTLKVRMDKALAGLQGSLITLGKDVAPTIVEILEELTGLLDRLTEKWNTLTDAQKRFRLIGVAAAAAIGPLALLLSSVIYIVSGIVELVYHLGKGVIALVKFGRAAMTSAAMLKALDVASVTSARGVAMIVGSLGVWAGALVAVTLGYIKLRKARKEAEEAMPSAMDTTALDPLKEQLKTIRGGDFANEDIENKMKLLSKMDAGQLQEFQGIIGTRIQLEKDFRVDLMAIREKGLADDEYILKRKSHLQELYHKLFSEQSTQYDFPEGSEIYKKSEEIISGLKNTISKLEAEIAVHKEEMGDWIDVQIEGIPKIIERYEEMGNTVEEELKKIGMSAKEIDNLTAAVNAYNEALDNIKSSHESELAYLEFMRNNAKELGIEFDYLGGKIELLKSTLEDLAKSGTLGSVFGKGVIEQLKQLPTNLYEVTKLIKDLDEDFDFLFEKSKIDIDFGINVASIDLLEDARDALIRFKLELKDTDVLVTPFGAAIPVVAIIDKKIELLTNDIKLFSAEQQRLIDTKTLSLLNAEADAFGTMAGKVDVLTYQLQAAKRNLRELLQEQSNPESNQIISDEMIKNAVANIQDLEIALKRLQNASDIKYLKDLYGAIGTADIGMQLLDANIRRVEDELRYLSEQNLEGTRTFELLADRLFALNRAKDVVDVLSGAFDEFFDAVIDGSENLGEVMGQIFKNIMLDTIKMLAKLLIVKTIMATLFPAQSAAKTAISVGQMLGIGLKEGGVVPEGYPNDTFPARLSSGEMVIPKDKYKDIDPLRQLAEKGRISASEFFDMPAEYMKTLQIPKLQHGGVIPPGYPNDTYPALLSSGETVLPAWYTGLLANYKQKPAWEGDVLKAVDTIGQRLHNFFSDLATGLLTWGTQLRKPSVEELTKGRGDWSGRAELLGKGMTWGMVDMITGEVTSKVVPAVTKKLANIPGLTADAPEKGYHALLSKEHWAWNPKKLIEEGADLQDLSLLYAEAFTNRMMPIIKKTPLVKPLRNYAEVMMSKDAFKYRETEQVFKSLFDKKNFERFYDGIDDNMSAAFEGRNLVKQYLYGNQPGFKPVKSNVLTLDFPERYKKLYPEAKTYMMESWKKHGERISPENIQVDFDPENIGRLPFDKIFSFNPETFANPIGPIDDISGHLAKIVKAGEDFTLISQDLWKFNPADYTKRWTDVPNSDKISGLFGRLTVEKQSALLDKIPSKGAGPFYLVQNNPISKEMMSFGKKFPAIGGAGIGIGGMLFGGEEAKAGEVPQNYLDKLLTYNDILKQTTPLLQAKTAATQADALAMDLSTNAASTNAEAMRSIQSVVKGILDTEKIGSVAATASAGISNLEGAGGINPNELIPTNNTAIDLSKQGSALSAAVALAVQSGIALLVTNISDSLTKDIRPAEGVDSSKGVAPIFNALMGLTGMLVGSAVGGGLFGGSSAAGGGGFLTKLIGLLFGKNKMMKGGIVPSGYPNDTYPAWLTSGEIVLPNSYRDLDIESLMNRGALPTGNINDEFQLLLSTYEKLAPEQVAKEKVTNRVYNYNNVTEKIMKMPRVKALAKFNVPKFPKEVKIGDKYLKKLTSIAKINKPAIPQVKVPKVRMPKDMGMKIPKLRSMKDFAPKMMKIKVPKIQAPKMPSVKIPKIVAPKISIPKIPKITAPKMPKIAIPKMTSRIPAMRTGKDKTLNYLSKISKVRSTEDKSFERMAKMMQNSKYLNRIAKMSHSGSLPKTYMRDTHLARLSGKDKLVSPQRLEHLAPAEVNVNLTLDSKIKNRDIALLIRRMKNWN